MYAFQPKTGIFSHALIEVSCDCFPLRQIVRGHQNFHQDVLLERSKLVLAGSSLLKESQVPILTL